jgi:hypothetical protein
MQHRFSSFAVVLASLALGAVVGCTVGASRGDGGGGGNPDGGNVDTGIGPGVEALLIMPANEVRTISGGVPVEIDYMAIHHAANGTDTDVTSTVTWDSTVSTLGAFTGNHFTSVTDHGGVTSIRARLGSLMGATSLTLHLDSDIVTASAPPDAPTMFGGASNPAAAPQIVYPLDGTMVPPNLQQLEIHFIPAAGTSVFRLEFPTSIGNIRIYFGCEEAVGGGCVYTTDATTWQVISDAGAGSGPLTYHLAAVDGSGGVGTTADRTIQIAAEPITGGLYYWNAAGGSIMRFDFGVPGAREEVFINQARTGAGICVGCHTVSRDGRRIAVGTDIPTTTFQVFDVASRMRIFSLGGGFPSQPSFASFSPDDTQIAVSSSMGINILDGATGSPILQRLGGGAATMPDWSADGMHMAIVRYVGAPIGNVDPPGVSGGTIVRLDFDGASWSVGPTLADAGGGNNYHPTYSPDGNWIVYNRSPSNQSSMGGDMSSMDCVTDAQTWAVAADGSGASLQLDTIRGECDTWPKFDPTTYRDHDHDLFWLAWASAREYGLRYGANSRYQIWMTAFDPAAATAGNPPTHAPFRLPFQNIGSGNHIAQWVTSVERSMCMTDADCPGEFCYEGRCYQVRPVR